jgi:hypothetical protein
VNAWFLRAPWWALALVAGGTFGGLRFLGEHFLLDESWTDSAVSGAIGGVLFGLVMGIAVARQNRRAREALGTDDPAVVRRATRAARGGPVPEEPALREAARRMAQLQHDQLVRTRRWAIPFFVLLIAGLVYLAIAVSPAGWLIVAVVAVFPVLFFVMPRRFARRAELLAGPADTAS